MLCSIEIDELDSRTYTTAAVDGYLKVHDVSTEILQFCMQQLEKQQPRADYAEFLQLIVVILGGKRPLEVTFRAPGAFHHARRMAKAIYCLKIYLFRNQFSLNTRELNGVRDICQFLV